MVSNRPTPAQRLRKHSLSRAMVLKDLRVMFLPIPKSGCTSMLWTLAGLAGLDRDRFRDSQIHEVSRAMAIHDTGLWEPEHRWMSYSEEQQNEILSDPEWLRFSIVRNPAPRLWSAWQSKILLREPRFVERFADEPWFPPRPGSLNDVVDLFRTFVHALDGNPDKIPHDAHWGVQGQLTKGFNLNFIGRSERMSESLERLGAHLGDSGAIDTDVPRENAAPIPYHRTVYDAGTAEIVNRLYADDFREFDYERLGEWGFEGMEHWDSRASERVSVANELAERHLRIGELLAALQRSGSSENPRGKRLEQRVQELSRAVTEADDRVRAMERSRSWRVTRPLRALHRLVGRLS